MEEKDMEQWNDVKDKKGSGVVIVLLLLIVLALGTFIFLNKDKLFGEENNKPEETEKQETDGEEQTVTFDNETLQEYVDYIQPISIGPSDIFGTNEIKASELDARQKIRIIGVLVFKSQVSSDDFTYSILSEEDVKAAVEKVYGPNTYKRTSFSFGCGEYEFHEDDKKYYAKTGCGGTSSLSDENIVIDHKLEGNKLEITTAYAFEGPSGIYRDYKQDIGHMMEQYTDGKHDSTGEYLRNYIKEHKDELNHLVYTFESTDGIHFYFTGLVNNRVE